MRLEREILAARDRRERQPDERHAPLFAVFATQWIEESRAGWKASTVAQYQQVLKSQLLPAFSDLRVSAITESRMRQLLTQLQDAGLSARRINLALLVLKMILRTAVRRRFVREDPTDTVRGILRIRAGRYRGKEGPPKTASSVRDIDLLPAVVEAFTVVGCGRCWGTRAPRCSSASTRATSQTGRAGMGARAHAPDGGNGDGRETWRGGRCVLPKYSR